MAGQRKHHPVLTQMEGLLSLDPNLVHFENIAAHVQSLKRSDRQRLLSLCESTFSDVNLRRTKRVRGAAATIVALAPYSADAIKRWINMRFGKYIYEVHFSLFCFLDEVPYLSDAGDFSTEIPSLIEAYLLGIKSEAAFAAWMAGDLMSDHWRTEEAYPVLIKAATEARFVAGREGALHGLEHLLDNLAESDYVKKSVTSLLSRISKTDRSGAVRDSARQIARGKSPCASKRGR